MQQLHLVGFTTDHRGLVFSVRRGAKSGSYVVPLDGELCAIVDEFRGRSDRSTTARRGTESGLSVREVQSRLRRGSSIAEVARAAGVDESWVERFASPVLAEHAEVIRTVKEARVHKPRLGASATPLGESVYRNLADRGVTEAREELDGKWRARQLHDGLWQVTFHHAWRGRDHEVVWELDESTGAVRPIGRLGAELAFRPRRSTAKRKPVPRPDSQMQLALVQHPDQADDPKSRPLREVESR